MGGYASVGGGCLLHSLDEVESMGIYTFIIMGDPLALESNKGRLHACIGERGAG